MRCWEPLLLIIDEVYRRVAAAGARRNGSLAGMEPEKGQLKRLTGGRKQSAVPWMCWDEVYRRVAAAGASRNRKNLLGKVKFT